MVRYLTPMLYVYSVTSLKITYKVAQKMDSRRDDKMKKKEKKGSQGGRIIRPGYFKYPPPRSATLRELQGWGRIIETSGPDKVQKPELSGGPDYPPLVSGLRADSWATAHVSSRTTFIFPKLPLGRASTLPFAS